MEEYLELIFDVFDETGQYASVRNTLAVAQLMDEIMLEFTDLSDRDLSHYALTLVGSNLPLDPNRTLSDQGVQSGDRLIYGWAQKAQPSKRLPIEYSGQVILQEVKTGAVFPIQWQPAYIGRPDIDHDHNELLAANLEWLNNGRRVSRRHAEITEKGGQFYLESLSSQNPTLLNGKPVQSSQKVPLRHNDRIKLGYSEIMVAFLLKGK